MIPYPSTQVANWFLLRAKPNGKRIKTQKLIKLVYIAHGWHLALTNGKPLVSEDLQAWKFGAVFPELYHRIKRFGSGEMEELIGSSNEGKWEILSIPENDYNRQQLLEEVYKSYVDYKDESFYSICHADDTPWAKRWGEMQKVGMTQSQIDPLDIEYFFKSLIQRVKYEERI